MSLAGHAGHGAHFGLAGPDDAFLASDVCAPLNQRWFEMAGLVPCSRCDPTRRALAVRRGTSGSGLNPIVNVVVGAALSGQGSDELVSPPSQSIVFVGVRCDCSVERVPRQGFGAHATHQGRQLHPICVEISHPLHVHRWGLVALSSPHPHVQY